ncbi:MAG: hypothetical protein ACK56I_30625, partial [bacterium]
RRRRQPALSGGDLRTARGQPRRGHRGPATAPLAARALTRGGALAPVTVHAILAVPPSTQVNPSCHMFGVADAQCRAEHECQGWPLLSRRCIP